VDWLWNNSSDETKTSAWTWLWDRVVQPSLAFGFNSVPWWVWFIVAGLLLGWAWKTFGWQGLVGAALAVLTVGAYRQGWRDSQVRRGKITQVEADAKRPTIVERAAKRVLPQKKGKRRYNADTNTWE
jgi:hypothetical protein